MYYPIPAMSLIPISVDNFVISKLKSYNGYPKIMPEGEIDHFIFLSKPGLREEGKSSNSPELVSHFPNILIDVRQVTIMYNGNSIRLPIIANTI